MFEKYRIMEVIRSMVRPLHANLVKTRQTGSELPNTSDGGDKLRLLASVQTNGTTRTIHAGAESILTGKKLKEATLLPQKNITTTSVPIKLA
jgi:hypothetical protein